MTQKKDDTSKADEKLITFVPAITFTGYPQPYKTNRKGALFQAEVESEPVPQSFVDLMREKGLVADKKSTAQASDK